MCKVNIKFCCCCIGVLRPFDTFQVISGAVNKNTKIRSFKSNEHILKKVDGPYYAVSNKKFASVTL